MDAFRGSIHIVLAKLLVSLYKKKVNCYPSKYRSSSSLSSSRASKKLGSIPSSSPQLGIEQIQTCLFMLESTWQMAEMLPIDSCGDIPALDCFSFHEKRFLCATNELTWHHCILIVRVSQELLQWIYCLIILLNSFLCEVGTPHLFVFFL